MSFTAKKVATDEDHQQPIPDGGRERSGQEEIEGSAHEPRKVHGAYLSRQKWRRNATKASRQACSIRCSSSKAYEQEGFSLNAAETSVVWCVLHSTQVPTLEPKRFLHNLRNKLSKLIKRRKLKDLRTKWEALVL